MFVDRENSAQKGASVLVKALAADYEAVRPHTTPMPARGADLIEQALNRGAALALLIFFSPIFLFLAIFILLQDGAPIVYGQHRVGRGGRLFRCLKFRSMVRDSEKRLADLLASDAGARTEWERDRKLTRDPRITPIGRFLRKSSLDELPQLFNVLRGDMNLVGPRPVPVDELSMYGVARWQYLSVRPGMTGLWQVSGRNLTTYEQRVRLDQEYIHRRSFWFDLWILVRTVRVVLTGHGAR